MSALTRHRDHARKMSTAEHKPECPSLGPKSRPIWEPVYESGDDMPSALRWVRHTPSPPTCSGCVTDDDRAMWKRMAAEADAYLEQETLT